MKNLTNEQSQKISAAYGINFSKIENRAHKTDESRLVLYADAYDLAARVAKKFNVSVGVLFSVYMPSLDVTAAKQINACKQSPEHSHLFGRDLKAKFSKIRFTGYMIAAKRKMILKPDDILPDVNNTGIEIKVYDLGLKDFKAALNGDGNSSAKLADTIDKLIVKLEGADIYDIVDVHDQIKKVVDLYEAAADAVNKEVRKRLEKENREKYETFVQKMKGAGLSKEQTEAAFIASGGKIPTPKKADKKAANKSAK